MRSFGPLITIFNDTDFADMRRLDTPGGKSATDTAIRVFIAQLNDFFTSFAEKAPTQEERLQYLSVMTHITAKINAAEYAYYLRKYEVDYPECPESWQAMASSNTLESFNKIPSRMKDWATKPDGLTFRHAESLQKVIKHLNDWSVYVVRPVEPVISQSTFFSRFGRLPVARNLDIDFEAAGALDPRPDSI